MKIQLIIFPFYQFVGLKPTCLYFIGNKGEQKFGYLETYISLDFVEKT